MFDCFSWDLSCLNRQDQAVQAGMNSTNGAEDDVVASQAGEQGKFQIKMNEIVAFAE